MVVMVMLIMVGDDDSDHDDAGCAIAPSPGDDVGESRFRVMINWGVPVSAVDAKSMGSVLTVLQ